MGYEVVAPDETLSVTTCWLTAQASHPRASMSTPRSSQGATRGTHRGSRKYKIGPRAPTVNRRAMIQ
jgi:hypothetical protein